MFIGYKDIKEWVCLKVEILFYKEKTEEVYYKFVIEPRFQYYLLDGDKVVGRVILLKRGYNLMDIQYVLKEKEYWNKRYGTVIFKLL